MVKYRSLFLSAFCAVFATSAFACAMLEEARPKVGSTVHGPVNDVTLRFSGKIYPEKSTLGVTDASGRVVSSGKAFGAGTTLATRVAPLAAGTYTVRWNAYCDCKSLMPGHYRFTVQ